MTENVGLVAVTWCTACGAEPAIVTIEAEVNGEWMPLDIGRNCLENLEIEE